MPAPTALRMLTFRSTGAGEGPLPKKSPTMLRQASPADPQDSSVAARIALFTALALKEIPSHVLERGSRLAVGPPSAPICRPPGAFSPTHSEPLARMVAPAGIVTTGALGPSISTRPSTTQGTPLASVSELGTVSAASRTSLLSLSANVPPIGKRPASRAGMRATYPRTFRTESEEDASANAPRLQSATAPPRACSTVT
jgi:hypothetical protein